MKSYKLTYTDKSKVAQALVRFAQPGGLLEPIVREGWSQAAFTLFLARLAHFQLVERKVDASTLAQIFTLVQAANSSAAKQAVEAATIEFEGEKPQSLSAYWAKRPGSAPAADLSLLGV